MRHALLAGWLGFSLSGAVLAEGGEVPRQPEMPEYFAKIDGEIIPIDEFMALMRIGVREKFYHGTPPEVELEKFKKETADKLIDRILLLREARVIGLRADKARVAEGLDKIEQRNKNDSSWQAARSELLPKMTARLENDDLLRQLEAKTREVAEPTEKVLVNYYNANHPLFTTPVQDKISLILLKVSPGSSQQVWDSTIARADELVKRLKAGERFERLARIHSGDPSAARGGDLGFMHQGMYGEAVQQVIDGMIENAVSEPVRLLDGVAIFRLVQRTKSELNPYSDVATRVRSLYLREQSDRQWQQLSEALRKKAHIELNNKL